jgi:hypothetical protein
MSEAESTYMRQDSMQMAGYLYKKSSGGEWQKRYFETNGNYLTYYKTHKMSKLLAAVALPQVGLIKLVGEVNDGKGSGFVFQIDLRDRQYLLRASGQDEAQRWVDYLILLRDGRLSTASNPMSPDYSNMMNGSTVHRAATSGAATTSSNSPQYFEPKATIQKTSRCCKCCRQ